MIEGRFRIGEIDDDFASVEERREIVGDRYAGTTTTRCLPGIITHSVMALFFDRTSQREGGRIFDKSNQPAAHATGSPCDNHVDHRMSIRAKTVGLLYEACIL